MQQHGMIGFPRKRRTRNIGHGQTWNAHLIRLHQNLTAISCLTRLADKDKERLLAEERHGIAPLRSNAQFNRCIRQLFQHTLRSIASMVRSSSCKDIETVSFLNSLDNIRIN